MKRLINSMFGCNYQLFSIKKNDFRGKLRVKVEKKEGYKMVDEIGSDVQLDGAFHEVSKIDWNWNRKFQRNENNS